MMASASRQPACQSHNLQQFFSYPYPYPFWLLLLPLMMML
jgi:hypothetical protein